MKLCDNMDHHQQGQHHRILNGSSSNSQYFPSTPKSIGGTYNSFTNNNHIQNGRGLRDYQEDNTTTILEEALRGQTITMKQSAFFTPLSPPYSSTNGSDSPSPPQMTFMSPTAVPLDYMGHLPEELSNLHLAKFTTEYLRREVIRKYFNRHPDKQESYYQKLGEEELIRRAFFDFVANVPMEIDGHFVSRKAWAKAFYEIDVISSAKCLFEALFNHKEMSTCTLNGKNNTQELCAIKMLAILRASSWMKMKNQDPYSFNPGIDEHNIHPTKEEQDKIEKKVFTERRSQANRKFKKRKTDNDFNTINSVCSTPATVVMDVDSDSQQSTIILDCNGNPDSQSPKPEIQIDDLSKDNRSWTISPKEVEEESQEKFDFGELEEFYYRCPYEFLNRLVPNTRDICIDGILVPCEKWEQAFNEASKDTVKAAWTLFQALFTENEIKHCTLNGKNGTNELNSIKRLAIIRAVEWMSQNSDKPSECLNFDIEEPGHNCFPSKEDKERIETKVFTEKRYQYSRQLTAKTPQKFINPPSN